MDATWYKVCLWAEFLDCLLLKTKQEIYDIIISFLYPAI